MAEPPITPERTPIPAAQADARAAETRITALASLEDDKARDIVTIDLAGRSTIADALIIATGTSSRHVAAIADNLATRLKQRKLAVLSVEGTRQGDWAVIDASDVIVHVFRAEVRSFYALEKMWGHDLPVPEAPPEPGAMASVVAIRGAVARGAAASARAAAKATAASAAAAPVSGDKAGAPSAADPPAKPVRRRKALPKADA